jgi:hypothetical protein
MGNLVKIRSFGKLANQMPDLSMVKVYKKGFAGCLRKY